MQQQVTSRYRALDGWRGICAILVALMHLEAAGWLSGSVLVRNSSYFVDFFFVLSGFVIAHAYGESIASPDGARRMIWRRFTRLWPLHVSLLVMLIVLEVAAHAISGASGIARRAALFDPSTSSTLPSIPTHIVLLQCFGLHSVETWNVPSWSIGAEFWASVVLAALAVTVTKRWVVPVIGMVAIAAAVIVVLFAPAQMLSTYDFGFFRCLYGFLVGYLVHALLTTPRAMRWRGTSLEAAAITLAAIFIVAKPVGWSGVLAPLVFAVVVAVFARSEGAVSALLTTAPVQRLGELSYSIYMIHGVVLLVMTRLGTVADALARRLVEHGAPGAIQIDWRGVLSGSISGDLAAFAYIAVVVGLSCLTWRWIEIPAQRTLNGLLPSPRKLHHLAPVAS